jgi:hypothetical protein
VAYRFEDVSLFLLVDFGRVTVINAESLYIAVEILVPETIREPFERICIKINKRKLSNAV